MPLIRRLAAVLPLAVVVAAPAAASAAPWEQVADVPALLRAADVPPSKLDPRDPRLLGSDQSAVRVVRARGSRWIRLTPRAARKYRHGRMSLQCRYADAAGDLEPFTSGTDGPLGPGLRLAVPRDAAYCSVGMAWRERRNSTSRFTLATVAFTKAGGRQVARVAAARSLMLVVFAATGDEAKRPLPATAELAAALGIEPLAAPGATVPEGRIGVWTDAARRIYTTTTLYGKRLYLDIDDATDDFSSNVVDVLFDE